MGEILKSTSHATEKGRETGKKDVVPRQLYPIEVFRSKVQKLEESEISDEIKELMKEWILAHINPIARESFIQKIKQRGSSIKIREMLEDMSDMYLDQHPEANERVLANPREELPKLFEGMFDVLFQWALSVHEGEAREEARQKVERLIARMKEIGYVDERELLQELEREYADFSPEKAAELQKLEEKYSQFSPEKAHEIGQADRQFFEEYQRMLSLRNQQKFAEVVSESDKSIKDARRTMEEAEQVIEELDKQLGIPKVDEQERREVFEKIFGRESEKD